MIERIVKVISALCRVISGVAFCFMALIAFADSIGRMLNIPLLGANEFVEFSLLVFFFASLCFVVRDDSHIRIGLFADLYKPKLAKLEKLFTSLGELVALCLLTYMMFDQASRLARFSTQSSFFKVPVAPWIYLAAALSIVAIWFAVQNIWKQRTPNVPREHAIPEEE